MGRLVSATVVFAMKSPSMLASGHVLRTENETTDKTCQGQAKLSMPKVTRVSNWMMGVLSVQHDYMMIH
jgi:hypothetical protein